MRSFVFNPVAHDILSGGIQPGGEYIGPLFRLVVHSGGILTQSLRRRIEPACGIGNAPHAAAYPPP